MHYALFDGEEIVGTLALHNRNGASATIHSGAQLITVRRRTLFKKHLHIERGRGNAAFTADALSRGVLTLGNASYRWFPRNPRWTEWTWQAKDGRDLLTIHAHHRLAAYQGDIYGVETDLNDLQKELALLGWYLLLLNQQNFGMHLLTAIDLRLGRNKVTASI